MSKAEEIEERLEKRLEDFNGRFEKFIEKVNEIDRKVFVVWIVSAAIWVVVGGVTVAVVSDRINKALASAAKERETVVAQLEKTQDQLLAVTAIRDELGKKVEVATTEVGVVRNELASVRMRLLAIDKREDEDELVAFPPNESPVVKSLLLYVETVSGVKGKDGQVKFEFQIGDRKIAETEWLGLGEQWEKKRRFLKVISFSPFTVQPNAEGKLTTTVQGDVQNWNVRVIGNMSSLFSNVRFETPSLAFDAKKKILSHRTPLKLTVEEMTGTAFFKDDKKKKPGGLEG